MLANHQQIQDELLELMTQLAGDWEYDGEVNAGTRLLRDLAMESLGLVVLGTSIQERYGRLPFSEFLAEVGQRPLEQRDVTIGELVDFVCQHRRHVAGEGVPR
ncbi:hypothetical protein EP7_000924 [Isosphaeraceae bacterium EP7]